MPDLAEKQLVLHYYHKAKTKEISSPDQKTENKLINYFTTFSMPCQSTDSLSYQLHTRILQMLNKKNTQH